MLSAFPVLHIPFKLPKVSQVQCHQPDTEGTLTVLILWLCSWQSLAALIHSLAGNLLCWERPRLNWCSWVVLLGTWDVCSSWVPGELQGMQPASSFWHQCRGHLWVVILALQDCLKSFTLPFLPKQEQVLSNKETPTAFPC